MAANLKEKIIFTSAEYLSSCRMRSLADTHISPARSCAPHAARQGLFLTPLFCRPCRKRSKTRSLLCACWTAYVTGHMHWTCSTYEPWAPACQSLPGSYLPLASTPRDDHGPCLDMRSCLVHFQHRGTYYRYYLMRFSMFLHKPASRIWYLPSAMCQHSAADARCAEAQPMPAHYHAVLRSSA